MNHLKQLLTDFSVPADVADKLLATAEGAPELADIIATAKTAIDDSAKAKYTGNIPKEVLDTEHQRATGAALAELAKQYATKLNVPIGTFKKDADKFLPIEGQVAKFTELLTAKTTTPPAAEPPVQNAELLSAIDKLNAEKTELKAKLLEAQTKVSTYEPIVTQHAKSGLVGKISAALLEAHPKGFNKPIETVANSTYEKVVAKYDIGDDGTLYQKGTQNPVFATGSTVVLKIGAVAKEIALEHYDAIQSGGGKNIQVPTPAKQGAEGGKVALVDALAATAAAMKAAKQGK